MIKLFRRLELGHNLDIEVHDALRRAGVHDVADLYGWVEAGWTHAGEPVRADLAMAVEKLAQAEDGWGLALDGAAGGAAPSPRMLVAWAARSGRDPRGPADAPSRPPTQSGSAGGDDHEIPARRRRPTSPRPWSRTSTD